MKKYELLEHTADAKVRAFGSTLEEAFENTALGTFSIIVNPKTVKPKIKKEFTIKAKRMLSLLYDFLEELLIYLDTDGWLLAKIETLEIDEKNFKLHCVAYGDYFKGYDVGGEIKSVTYSDMEIKKTPKGYEITVVHDL